jgi:signal transduction histidine kinase
VSDRPKIVGQWDETRLCRTLTNLLTNACKYGDTTQPITVTLNERGKGVSIAVGSLGEPIDPELMPLLFDPFKRGVADSKVKGLGLGLYITAEMIDKHGGSIDVESTRERGTIFTVFLPKVTRRS